jgi:hypothetical protein
VNWKNTWILVGLAAALFAFIMLFERHMTGSGYVERPKPLFADFKPAAATTIQLRRGNQPALTLERTNGLWHFTKPFSYPAANFTVQSFLEKLQRIVPATHISTRELSARKQTAADFGFDPAPVVLTLSNATSRRELHIGSRTTAGDQVYVQLIGTPGYFVVGADLLDGMLPRTPHEWRDTALFRFGDEKVDRAEIVQNGTGFVLGLDPTNRLWRLAWPPHRADQLQVRQLLDRLVIARALEFVADGPQADLESFGLQMPEYELALTAGGVTQRVQFGRSPTNDPSRVYARSMTYSNVVLVPRSYVVLLGAPYADLRDRQLVAFAPELVDRIEVAGEETFTVRRTASNTWTAGDAPVDPVFIAQWLALLSQLQVSEFVKDVVTDFAPYGLSPPQRRYSLYTMVTNATGPTNIFIARVDLGTNGSMDKAFARRWDEESLYGIRMLDFTHMPAAAWQLRDHRVWNFATNQVSKITVTQEGNVREVMRQPNGQWVGVKGFDGEINPFAMEELAVQLGDLNALMWIARGESARTQYGFTTNTAQLSVELRGEKPQTLMVEFGALSPLLRPYALTMVNGQPYVFEFPWTILADLQRYFGLAPTGPGLKR